MVLSRNGGRGYKIHPDRTGSCVQMVAVPSTALDMGNVKKSITIMGTGELRRHLGPWRGECLVTALHNSFVVEYSERGGNYFDFSFRVDPL